MNSGAEGPLTIGNGQFFFLTECMANYDFSEPPRRADAQNLIFIFLPNFRVRVTSGAWESVSVGCWGSRQLNFFSGGV